MQKRRKTIQGVFITREEYDFSKSIKNPLSIKIETIEYFKELSTQ